MKINVIAHCNSSNARIIESESGYHVYTTKPPLDGAANKDIIKQLSKFFKIPKSKIVLTKGDKSKLKHFELLS